MITSWTKKETSMMGSSILLDKPIIPTRKTLDDYIELITYSSTFSQV